MDWVFASRGRIALVTLALLLLLDLGRSIYARAGYAHPTETWQPDPAVYADITWPPGAALPPGASLGQRVFAQHCAICHGPDGRGNGPAAPSLIPHPRDFTTGEFKYRSTASGDPPLDADLIRVVRDGLQASAMPYWRDLLSDTEIRAVVEYVKGFSPVFKAGSPQPLTVPPRIPPDVASLARGQKLFQTQCASCHGIDGRAQLTLKDPKGYPVIARDLTAPWTFRGGTEPEQIWIRLTTGLPSGPMPSFADKTTPAERWDLVNYVLALSRTPPWEPNGRLDGPGQQANLLMRGSYLVHAEMCGLCHTPINRTGIYRGDDFYLGGGMRVGVYPHGVFISRNLTSDPETGLGRWSEEQIVAALTNGRAPDRILNLWDMPWIWLHQLDTDDARAIARYMKTTLPPVRDRAPGPLHYGVVETVLVKLTRHFPEINPGSMTFADGVFGHTGPGLSRDLPQRLLIAAQWVVLVGGAIAFVRVPSSFLSRTRRRRRRGARIFTVVGLIFISLIAWGIYGLPMLRLIPPAQISAAVTSGVPRLNPTTVANVQQRMLAERGRYLFMVASCALCHLPDGAGGSKISWKPFGSLWSRNITPDPDTGVGKWSEAEIGRAIRSGVTPDGRTLHWQGMIWDHASNWDEEDLRAMIAYLRTLPPVRRQIPKATPPSPEDCTIYTFWTSQSLKPGCH